jgi:hypothetical protein
LSSVFSTGIDAPAFSAGLSVGTARFAAVLEPDSLALVCVALAGLLLLCGPRRRSTTG